MEEEQQWFVMRDLHRGPANQYIYERLSSQGFETYVTIQQVVFLYTQWIKSTVKFFNNWKVPIFPKFPYPPTAFYSARISESSFESNTLKINK